MENILKRAEELLEEKNRFIDSQFKQIETPGNNDYTDQGILYLLIKIAELESRLEEIHPTLS